MSSSNELYERYSRQLSLKEIGEAGQQKLLQAKVLMIGAGGLGCAVLQYLAAAGVGHIGIVDDDTVTLSNLHRQVLYTTDDIGRLKTETAAKKLRLLNPGITITAINEKLTAANALGILSGYDIVIDGTDNFSSRYMINDACVLLNKPLVYGAVSKFEGQVAVFNCDKNNHEPVNYRDLFPHPPAAGTIANCEEAGVLGVLPGLIGVMQANETIKLITGIGKPLINRMFTINALNYETLEVEISSQKETKNLIPKNAETFAQTDYDWLCGVKHASNEIDAEDFNELRKKSKILIADVREHGELPLVNEFEHIHIPLGNIESNFPDTALDTIVVFCQSGIRSLKAAEILTAKFGNSKKVFSLAGGILQWKKEDMLQSEKPDK